MSKMHVKTGDTVVLLTGKYDYKYKNKEKDRRTGKVLEVSPKEGKVIVEGFNIVRAEAPIYACKVQLVCPKCGQPTRTGSAVEDGKKVRVCKKCGKSFE